METGDFLPQRYEAAEIIERWLGRFHRKYLRLARNEARAEGEVEMQEIMSG